MRANGNDRGSNPVASVRIRVAAAHIRDDLRERNAFAQSRRARCISSRNTTSRKRSLPYTGGAAHVREFVTPPHAGRLSRAIRSSKIRALATQSCALLSWFYSDNTASNTIAWSWKIAATFDFRTWARRAHSRGQRNLSSLAAHKSSVEIEADSVLAECSKGAVIFPRGQPTGRASRGGASFPDLQSRRLF